MPIRAIAFDLDDTLLRPDASVSDYTVDVLRRTAERGIIILPASGRTRDSMWPAVQRIGCASAFISCNGADVWTTDRELLTQELLPVELGQDMRPTGAFTARPTPRPASSTAWRTTMPRPMPGPPPWRANTWAT